MLLPNKNLNFQKSSCSIRKWPTSANPEFIITENM